MKFLEIIKEFALKSQELLSTTLESLLKLMVDNQDF